MAMFLCNAGGGKTLPILTGERTFTSNIDLNVSFDLPDKYAEIINTNDYAIMVGSDAYYWVVDARETGHFTYGGGVYVVANTFKIENNKVTFTVRRNMSYRDNSSSAGISQGKLKFILYPKELVEDADSFFQTPIL